MKNNLLTLVVLFVFTHSIQSQTVTLRDQVSLQPIENVSITTRSGSFQTQTNSKGLGYLNGVLETDTLVFQHPSYQQQTFSQPELAARNFTLNLVEKSILLDEVVISATRFEEKSRDIPQQITVITAKEIGFMNQPTTAEVLQNTGQVLVQKSQLGGGSPIIRGFEASRVLLVVDGVRMNNAIYRAGHLQNVLTIDNFMLDRTEIAFGPSSVMYGSDALGGTMNFITKRPLLGDSLSPTNIKANASTRYSSAMNEKTAHVDFNIGTKKFATLTGFTMSDFGDLKTGTFRNPYYGDWGKQNFYAERVDGKDVIIDNRHNSDLQKGTAYKQYDVFQKFLYSPKKGIENTLGMQYSTSSDINRYDRLTDVNSAGKLRNAQWYYGPQKRLFVSNTLQLSNTTIMYDKFRLILGFQDIEESRHNRFFGSSILNHRIEKVKVYSFNLDLQKRIGINELSYGLEATYNEVKSTANSENIVTGESKIIDTRYPKGGSTMSTYAAYLTDNIELSKKIILSGGLRFTNTTLTSKFGDKTFFPFPFDQVTQKNNSTTGNIGLVYMPGMDWRFSTIASSGFKAPNVDDMTKVFESVAGRVIVPNPKLKPEHTYNIDLGISKTIQKQVTLSANGFYTWYNGVAVIKPSDFEGQDSILYDGKKSLVTTPTNAQNAYLYGFNAQIKADVTKHFSINSSVTYTYGRIKTDSTDYPLDHIPPVFGKTSANLHIQKFRGEFFVLYNGWKRLSEYNKISGEDNLVYSTPEGVPSWVTLNLRSSYQLNKYLQLQAAVENILDQHYRVFASGISAPGRNFIFSMKGSF